ncbi:hypothetical protein nbrc107696_32900 [Gordonia spumicola]|uniref:DUF1345 domain-containing protein n=1 Tax=Gordonia spumicola TaxID=589161 RepID=A0A7I9VC39_9ACTN|nr:DUF1345 domain-containing protein [Gordonia spumicola]GEE02844.1 hypothetical protein nbrc107696_32900 [Gordonia spumicola]
MRPAVRDAKGSTRYLTGLGVGLLIGAAIGFATQRWALAALSVMVTAAVVYLVWSIGLRWPADAEETRAHATAVSEDDEIGDLAVLAMLGATLATIIVLLLAADGADANVYAGVAVVAVVSAWAMLHTLYAEKYARMYYQGGVGGIDFNCDAPPRYVDFFYFSFNLGMTYQVSDTSVTDTAFRAVTLKHCLASYAYGTVIIACTINLVMNLLS